MPNPQSRRTFLAGAAGALASPALAQGRYGSYAAEMPNMLPAFIAARLNALATRWDRTREGLTTPAAIEARSISVRENLRNMLHGAPLRNPLAPVVVATHKRAGYRVENVMFQSRPDFWVTGNLYVPEGSGPFPAVISPCGHYPWARMEPEYQFAYMNMVKAGLVVLAYDPVGQGERRQYWDPRTGRTEVAPQSTFEHSMPGQLLLLMGEDLTHYCVWDGVRAIDYLLTRPEVDPKRIGCAGHSGGGTLTRFITAFDPRVACAVVNEGGVGHRWPVHLSGGALGPSDVEQNIFPAAIYGIDACDLLASVAPRPVLCTIEDYNPNFDSAVEHLRKVYGILGAADRFAAEEAADPHSWTPKLRIATTNWFCRWFYNRPGPNREPDFEPEKPATLYCTPNGSLRYSQKGQSVWSLLRAHAAKLPPARPSPLKAPEVAEMLRFRKAEGPLAVRRLAVTPRKGYSVEKVEFFSEPGIYIPAWVFVPEKPKPGPITLFLSEAGKESEGKEFERLERWARKGHTIVAADVRGVGATAGSLGAGREGEFGHLFSGETGVAYMCWYMDESLMGMRVSDVIRTVDYALSRPDAGAAGVRAVGRGAGALWALFAAALDSRITEVQAERGLLSYRALTAADRYAHSAGIFLRDVLLRFDLPQVAAIVPAKVTLLSPVDHMKRPVEIAAARAAYKDEKIAIRSGAFELD